MFKIVFNTERRTMEQGGRSKYSTTGRGYYVTNDYRVAQQIRRYLEGIRFDNPNDDMRADVFGTIHTGGKAITINLDMITHIHEELSALEEAMTAPSELPSRMAAE